MKKYAYKIPMPEQYDGRKKLMAKDIENIRCGSDACLLCKKYVHCANCPVGKAGHLHCRSGAL